MTLSRRSVTSDLPPTHLSLALVDLCASRLSRLEHPISSFFEPYRDERATVRICEWWRRTGDRASQPPFPYCIYRSSSAALMTGLYTVDVS
jgi:hypothetical protein